MKTLCCVMSYEITKGMKSRGPIGLLKKNNKSEELILKQIDSLNSLFLNNDICVVTGFGSEKIQKRIPTNISVIVNDKFNQANQMYALKLFLNTIQPETNYDGIFILTSNIIIKHLKLNNLNKSWILTKNNNNRTKNEALLGIGLDSTAKINTIFYNLGTLLWCNAVYLCKKDVEIIKNNLDKYYDNMFLFEMINKSIDEYHLNIGINTLYSNNDCIIIRGPKDKHKII